jgi:hypothetical protein
MTTLERTSMKRLVIASALLSLMVLVPSLFAQEGNHGEVGVFADYLRLNEANNTNYAGVGGRVGFNVAPRVQIEGQLRYDFEQTFTVRSGSTVNGTIARSSTTLLHGLLGPKFVGGTEHARVFGTVQGGFIRFGVSNSSITSGFTGSLGSFGDTNTHGSLYPGVGAEFYVGPVGLRLDVGDVIYWNNGAHHNLNVGFGPQIKF